MEVTLTNKNTKVVKIIRTRKKEETSTNKIVGI